MKVALTIAGSDSGGGAGIQADIKTFAAHGIHGASAITAVTAQNTVGVTDYVALEPRMVTAQIDAVSEDMNVVAWKTGMLANAEIIEVVADRLKAWKIPNLVVDPVMVAKSGDKLLEDSAVQALIQKILPLATVVTPNLPEAEVLTGKELTDETAVNNMRFRAAAEEVAKTDRFREIRRTVARIKTVLRQRQIEEQQKQAAKGTEA